MFEKEIEFIYKYNLNKIKHLGSFITYEQLVSTDIHPALLQYLSAEIDFLIYEDRQKLLKESLFDYSGDKIIEHFASIGEEIKRTKKFSYEYLNKLLLHASSFSANFIIRPKWSLMQFVFENENELTKQIVEVKQVLNYLYYYPYLKRLLVNFFDKKRMISISKVELKELLDKIDKINYESNFDKVLDSALTSMAEFMYMGEVNNNKVSKQFVELFLADKGLSHFGTILDEKLGSSTIDKFQMSEFKNIILNYNSDDDIDSDEPFAEEEPEDIINESEDILDNSLEEELLTPDENIDDDVNTIEEEIESKVIIEEENSDDIIETIETEEKKSFLESHIENLDDEVESREEDTFENIEELEPPELDEAPRVDEKNIDEIYELVTEEEKIDAVVEDDDTDLPRMEIDDDENPFEKVEEAETEEDKSEELTKSNGTEFIEPGSSITFSSDELATNTETVAPDLETEEATENEVDEWPSESSNGNEKEDNSSIDQEEMEEVSDSEEVSTSEEIDKVENRLEEKSIDAEDDSELESNDYDNQQMLFDEEELDNISNIEDNSEDEKEEEPDSETETIEEVPDQSIDISLLLENKKITKIIEVVFDYDMEEFANAIDRISECRSETEAHTVIDEVARRTYIDSSVKEIKVFKNIISEYFK